VSANAVEAHQLLDVVAEPFVVVSAHADKVF
jgi:hypothetical protein